MELLIDTYGTAIGATGERVVLKMPEKPGARSKKLKKEYSIRRLDKIVILRPSSISTQAVQLALEHEVDIVYLGAFGKPIGRIFSSNARGLATLRRAQLAVSSEPRKALGLARNLIFGKCRNQVRFMRRLSELFDVDTSNEQLQADTALRSIAKLLPSRSTPEELLGYEGRVAECYWRSMQRFLTFPGRKPEGRDKFNSALNYGYGILYHEVERACLYIGLDPYLGLLHSERYGKPALVLDLVEEFRVSVVDSVIIPLFINKELGKRGDFERVGTGQYQLSAQGKSKLVGAVLRRLDAIEQHKGSQRTLRSAIKEQSEHLARIFLGKEALYIPFEYVAS